MRAAQLPACCSSSACSHPCTVVTSGLKAELSHKRKATCNSQQLHGQGPPDRLISSWHLPPWVDGQSPFSAALRFVPAPAQATPPAPSLLCEASQVSASLPALQPASFRAEQRHAGGHTRCFAGRLVSLGCSPCTMHRLAAGQSAAGLDQPTGAPEHLGLAGSLAALPWPAQLPA